MGTLYVATTGNDGTAVKNNPALPWLTIQAACAAASSGDTVQIAAGTYDLGTDSVTAPANGGITGVGTVVIQYATDLHVTGCAILPGATNCLIQNLQGQCKASTLATPSPPDPGTYSAFIGTANFNGIGGRTAAQAGCVNATIRNCSEVGYTDGFFVVTFLPTTILFDLCTASSPWDNWAVGDLSPTHDQVLVTITNCSVIATGPPPSPFGGNPTHGIEVSSAHVNVVGGSLNITGGVPSAAVHTVAGGSSQVSVCGTSITVAGGAVAEFAEGGPITGCPPSGGGTVTTPPCSACGAPIDCPNENDYTYTLTGDPTFPYSLFCPVGICLPTDGPSPISLVCCGHTITRYIFPTTTQQELSDIVQGMIQECEQYAGECSDPPPPDETINPRTFYFNSPQTCTVPC